MTTTSTWLGPAMPLGRAPCSSSSFDTTFSSRARSAGLTPSDFDKDVAPSSFFLCPSSSGPWEEGLFLFPISGALPKCLGMVHVNTEQKTEDNNLFGNSWDPDFFSKFSQNRKPSCLLILKSNQQLGELSSEIRCWLQNWLTSGTGFVYRRHQTVEVISQGFLMLGIPSLVGTSPPE